MQGPGVAQFINTEEFLAFSDIIVTSPLYLHTVNLSHLVTELTSQTRDLMSKVDGWE